MNPSILRFNCGESAIINSLELLGIWEQLNNLCFNPIEFDGIKKQSGLNSFILTAKQWAEKTVGLSQGDRLKRLNEIAIRQMQVLTSVSAIKQLKE